MQKEPMPKLPDAPARGSWWIHVKSGRTYQIELLSYRESDLSPLVTYRLVESVTHSGRGGGVWLSETEVWTRPLSEFMDGRFGLKEWGNA